MITIAYFLVLRLVSFSGDKVKVRKCASVLNIYAGDFLGEANCTTTAVGKPGTAQQPATRPAPDCLWQAAAAPALDQETDEGQECVHGGLGGGRAEAGERAGPARQPRQGPAAADRLHDAGQIPAGALC